MRIAVLGCGSIGRRHIGCLQQLGYADLVLYDPGAESREAVKQQFGLSCCFSEEDVWRAKPEIALVTSPAPAHIRLARLAVAHGCHIFIEKPLANSLDGVDELILEVDEADVISMVGCNMRFHPGPLGVHRMIKSGRIGTVLAARLETGSYLPNWRPWQDYRRSVSARAESGGGVLLECIHEIDLSLWLFGPGKLIGAALQRAASLGIDVEGLAEILIRHNNGTLSSVHLNFVQRNYRRTCQVIGTDGTLLWDFAHPWIELRRAGSEVERTSLDDQWQLDAMYRDEMAQFLECVRSRRQTSSTIVDGCRALEIALGAHRFDAMPETEAIVGS